MDASGRTRSRALACGYLKKPSRNGDPTISAVMGLAGRLNGSHGQGLYWLGPRHCSPSAKPALELFHVKLSTPLPDKDDILPCGSLFRQPAPVDRQQLPKTLGLSTLFPATRPWICPHLGVEFRVSRHSLATAVYSPDMFGAVIEYPSPAWLQAVSRMMPIGGRGVY